MRPRGLNVLITGAVAVGAAATAMTSSGRADDTAGRDPAAALATTTPIKHLVVIFQENVSFDHYFGTYPKAANPPGQPVFHASPSTPTINGLSGALLSNNPNAANPQRLDRSEAITCDQNHDYTPEQTAYGRGVMDRFVENTSDTTGTPPHSRTRGECDIPSRGVTPGDQAVMDYYDGNTVTALWNLAQHFSMSDNSFSTTFGPSTPGALNVVAGNTYPALCGARAGTTAPGGNDPDVYDGHADVTACKGGIATSNTTVGGTGHGTVVGDPDQYYDVCSNPSITAALGGPNIGDSLSARGITWGWFNGGFQNAGYTPGVPSSSTVATARCTLKHYNIGAGAALDGRPCTSPSTPPAPVDAFCQRDYSAHHQPFQYYASTSNPQHLAPATVAEIGHNGVANHQYDLADFWAASKNGTLPAVSYLKAPRFQDGHARNSDPLDEQHFLVDTLNALQKTPDWASTAVIINYDDSDGWYDHVVSPILTQSQTPLDDLNATGQCGANPAHVPTDSRGLTEPGRCGLGPRQPLLVVSPYSRQNHVDHQINDQASVVHFIEDNWGLSRLGNGSVDAVAGPIDGLFDFSQSEDNRAERLFLDPVTGQPVSEADSGPVP